MPKEEQHRDGSAMDAESAVRKAVAGFEKILEAMPNDRVTLEALADAYDQLGEPARAKEYYLRLARVLVQEGEEDAAQDVLDKLMHIAPGDPEVSKVREEIENIKPDKIMADVFEEVQAEARPRAANISDEIAFAWHLLEAGKLNKDEYAAIVHDLSENSTKTSGIPVSTLHVLSDKGASNILEIMAFVSNDRGIPIISLNNFEFLPSTASILPLDFMIQRKVLVFDMMGKDALAAILNPYDAALQSDFLQISGMEGHFFLVLPIEFDNFLERIKKELSETEKEK